MNGLRSLLVRRVPLAAYLPMAGLAICIPAAGCSNIQNEVVEPLDLRAIEVAKPDKRATLRIVLGVRDFEGDFSEEFRTSRSPLPTEDRKRWRDMGLVTFPDRVAQYLQKRETVLDAYRDNIETTDLILTADLKEFRRDWQYKIEMVPIYMTSITTHMWTVTSQIVGEFKLADPTGRVLTTFEVRESLDPVVLKKSELTGLAAMGRGMPPEVEEEFGKTAREFLTRVLDSIETKIIEAQEAFDHLQRPDLETAQHLSDELLTGEPRNQWAVVVGVSRYQRGGSRFPDLRFADRDANEFCEFLLSPAGGGFKKDHVLLLTNADATYSAIRNGLFTFLKDAAEDDLVVIFFSGHGAPDPARPDNLYLLPYDVDPSDIAASAFPMWDMEKVLWQIVRSQRVVVFADACHSAGVAEGAKGVGVEAQKETTYQRYFRRLAHTRPGRVVFSSSGGGEVSLEAERWDRHGVFTWALLRALKGQADGILPGSQRDGIVTLQEAIRFVEHHVVEETENRQHPFLAASPKYDVHLPLGIAN